MDKKCSKYEGLFVFSDEETLKSHLNECEECRLEQEKMDKVSDLIDEVKFYYHAKRKRKRKPFLKAACVAIFLLFTTVTYSIYENYDVMMDTLQYVETLSAEDLGFPVDSYGLIAVDE